MNSLRPRRKNLDQHCPELLRLEPTIYFIPEFLHAIFKQMDRLSRVWIFKIGVIWRLRSIRVFTKLGNEQPDRRKNSMATILCAGQYPSLTRTRRIMLENVGHSVCI